jgi:predicted PurR-regulated permease PerM
MPHDASPLDAMPDDASPLDEATPANNNAGFSQGSSVKAVATAESSFSKRMQRLRKDVLSNVVWLLTGLALLALLALEQWLAQELILLLVWLWLLYALLPWVQHLEKGLRASVFRFTTTRGRYAARPLAIFIVLGFLVWLLAFQVSGQLPTLRYQLRHLSTQLPVYSQTLQRQLQHWLGASAPVFYLTPKAGLNNGMVKATSNLAATPPTATRPVGRALPALSKSKGSLLVKPVQSPSTSGSSTSNTWLQLVVKVGSSTAQGLLYAITGLILLVYGLHDAPRLASTALNHYMPTAQQPVLKQWAGLFHTKYSGFVQAQLVMGLGTYITFYLLYKVLGLPYAAGLAGLVGVSSLVPVLGTWLGLLPSLMVAVVQRSEGVVLCLVLAIVAFNSFKYVWVKPRLLPQHNVVHPVASLVLFLGSYQVLGLWSLFMVPFLQTVLLSSYECYQQEKAQKTRTP